MSIDRRILLFVPAFALAAPALPGASAGTVGAARNEASQGGLCAADETILFQCRTGRRLVSVCGSRAPAPGTRYLFGNPGRVEYVSPGSAAFSWSQSNEGGDRLEIRFSDAGRDHVVYSHAPVTGASADGRMAPYSVDGVRISQGGRTLVDRRCAGEASRHGRVQDFMPPAETPDR